MKKEEESKPILWEIKDPKPPIIHSQQPTQEHREV